MKEGKFPFRLGINLNLGVVFLGVSFLSFFNKVTMKSTKASLTETIQYMCRGKVLASETRELASVSRGKIRPGEGEEWLNEQMYVPPLPPTNLRGCHLINILYHVYVRKKINK